MYIKMFMKKRDVDVVVMDMRRVISVVMMIMVDKIEVLTMVTQRLI